MRSNKGHKQISSVVVQSLYIKYMLIDCQLLIIILHVYISQYHKGGNVEMLVEGSKEGVMELVLEC